MFLTLAGFFTAWEGQAVSVRKNEPEQAVYSVLIAPDDGERFETTWPRIAVTGLNLKVDSRAIPALPLREGLPRTSKQRFALGFSVTPEGGTPREVPTTTPQSAAIAILLFFVGLGVRNMVVAGTPIGLEPRGVTLPKAQAAAGQAAAPRAAPKTTKARAKKGPPPSKPRRGGGRRR